MSITPFSPFYLLYSSCNKLLIFLWLCTDCEVLQQRTIWSCEVRQIFKEWVHIRLSSWLKCHCRVDVHNQMFLQTLISAFPKIFYRSPLKNSLQKFGNLGDTKGIIIDVNQLHLDMLNVLPKGNKDYNWIIDLVFFMKTKGSECRICFKSA